MTNLDSTPLEPSLPAPPGVALFGHPRDYLGNRFVYIVISQRARGLSIGVNLTPDRECNFNCIYCEVDRDQPVLDRQVDLGVLAGELDQVLENILALSRLRPVVIQSLFPQVAGAQPPLAEIEAYIERLRWLKAAGAQIALVQVYSAHRPAHRPECAHLPLRSLSWIACRVREATGLRAEVF